jgi:hypothetical protein
MGVRKENANPEKADTIAAIKAITNAFKTATNLILGG